jgi:ParB-like chromosome segregation protein Spo0J
MATKKGSTDNAATMAAKINPALDALARPIATLKLDERNARKHERRSLDTIKTSLSTYGQQKPIVALTSGVVIAGNGTLEAARELGWDRLAVVTFDNEDEARARAFAIMDNRSAELSSWNQDQLIESLQSFDESLLKSVGFTDEALKTMIEKTHVEFDTTSKLNSAMFRVIVENLDERQQLLLINNLESQGFNCKAMMM